MNSFTLTAVGTLARNPGISTSGNLSYARFCLVGSDFEEIEGAVKERLISMWFVAFGAVGDSLVKYARKGDQLILEATAVVDDWSGRPKDGMNDYIFEVLGFRFGSRRCTEGPAVTNFDVPPTVPGSST
jgi:single-stranded DNA-binding protein